jgi:CBS domain-containing protein
MRCHCFDLSQGVSGAARKELLMANMQASDALVPHVLVFSTRTTLAQAVSLFNEHHCELAVVLRSSSSRGSSSSSSGSDVTSTYTNAEQSRARAKSVNGDADDTDYSADYSLPQFGTGLMTAAAMADSSHTLPLVGIASLRDVVKAVETDCNGQNSNASGESLCMGDVCRRDYLSVWKGAPLRDAATCLERNSVKYLPVVQDRESQPDAEHGLPLCCGLISRDSLRVAVRLKETQVSIQRATFSSSSSGREGKQPPVNTK